MNKPVLVIMAAGMSSRYGSLKQIDPIDDEGHIIIDFSVFDAHRAGFDEVVFLIKRSIDEQFRAAIGDRVSKYIKVSYAYQELDMLPEGITLPEGREKPLGTTHAVLCARQAVGDRPFAVINADDYYGPEAFCTLYEFLSSPHASNEHIAIGYPVENTLPQNGEVTRGVCQVDEGGYLTSIVERMRIGRHGDGAAATEEDGTVVEIPRGTTVSMNCWGFSNDMFNVLYDDFCTNIADSLKNNPMKYEALLPISVCSAINAGRVRVHVVPTHDAWFGVTHKDDKGVVMEKLKELKRRGIYTEKLWDAAEEHS